MTTRKIRSSHQATAAKAVATLAAALVVGTTGASAATASTVDDGPAGAVVEAAAEEAVVATAAEPEAPVVEPEAPAADVEVVAEPEVPSVEVTPAVEDDAPTPAPPVTDIQVPAPDQGTPAPPAPTAEPAATTLQGDETVVQPADEVTAESHDMFMVPTGVEASHSLGTLSVFWQSSSLSVVVGVAGTDHTIEVPGFDGAADLQLDLPPGNYQAYVHPSGYPFAVAFASFVVAEATVPVSPWVGALQTGPDEAEVQWMPGQDDASTVTGYRVVVDGGEPVPYPADATGTLLTGLAKGEHTVSVSAENAQGWSEPAEAEFQILVEPSPPRDLAVSVDTDTGDATVSWLPPAELGYPAVTTYVVTLRGDGDYPQAFLDDGTLQHVFEDLAPGSYEVDVFAESNRESSEHTTLEFDVLPPVEAPTGITAVQVGPQAMRVTWVDDSDDERIVGYRVVAVPGLLTGELLGGVTAAAPADGTVIADVGPDDRSVELDGLLEGTAYRFTVAALTADGAGPTGETAAPTADEWRAPSAVRDASVTQTGPRQITVRFDAPADEGTSPVLRYVVGLASSESGGYEEFDPDTREVVIDDLDPLYYDLGVLAENSEGSGPRVDLGITVRADWTAPVVLRPVTPPVAAPVASPVVVPVVQGRPAPAAVAAPAALARTGAEAGVLAAAGMLLVGLGGVLTAATRRMRRIG